MKEYAIGERFELDGKMYETREVVEDLCYCCKLNYKNCVEFIDRGCSNLARSDGKSVIFVDVE